MDFLIKTQREIVEKKDWAEFWNNQQKNKIIDVKTIARVKTRAKIIVWTRAKF